MLAQSNEASIGIVLAMTLPLAFVMLFMVIIIKWLIMVVPAGKVLVLAGRTRVLADGSVVGYRALKGGRTLRIPMIESVQWLDLTPAQVRSHASTRTSDGKLVDVRYVADVAVNASSETIDTAIANFIAAPPDRIAEAATERMDAQVEALASSLTFAELTENPLGVAAALAEMTEPVLHSLGLSAEIVRVSPAYTDVATDRHEHA